MRQKRGIICSKETLASCFSFYEAGQEADVNIFCRIIETFVSRDWFSPPVTMTGGGKDIGLFQ